MGRWENLIWHATSDLLPVLYFLFHFPTQFTSSPALLSCLWIYIYVYIYFIPALCALLKTHHWINEWMSFYNNSVFMSMFVCYRTQTSCWCTTWMCRQWMTVGSHAVRSSAPSTRTGKSGPSGAKRSSLDSSNLCVSFLNLSTNPLMSHVRADCAAVWLSQTDITNLSFYVKHCHDG